MLLGDLLVRNSRLCPETPALRFEGRTVSYGDLNARVNRLAHAISRKVRRGDRVAFLSKNRPELIELYFANAKAGTVTVPVNCRLTPAEAEYVISHSDARLLFVAPEFRAVAEAAASAAPGLQVVELDLYETLIAQEADSEPAVPVADTEVLWQMYTSGTTGRPKGAMLTHRNAVANLLSYLFEIPAERGDRFLVVTPLYHVAAVIFYLRCIAQAGTAVLHADFAPARVLRDIQEHKVNFTSFVPTMIQALLDAPELARTDLSSLKVLSYGAAPMPAEVLRRAVKAFPCRFVQGYGQTEALAVLSILRPEDHVLDGPPEKMRRLSSCGREIFGVTLRVVDGEGRGVAPGEVGEIVAKGDSIMAGYYKMPEETAKALQNGWLHTGDLATVDTEGYITIVDRAKDMIISGGENIYPREIEEVLHAHPAVADAAVIGIPDGKWGEVPLAVVVARPGTVPGEEEIIAHCRKRLAGFKVPKRVEFVKELPRNPSGKVLKRVLREPYWKGRERRVH
ncbi:MAG: long-chain-fatty-acid--CoA ligase [Halobacteria archaeon]